MIVKSKAVALKNHFSNTEEVREIDIDPPILYGDSQVGIRRLKKDKLHVDKNLHRDGSIKK